MTMSAVPTVKMKLARGSLREAVRRAMIKSRERGEGKLLERERLGGGPLARDSQPAQ